MTTEPRAASPARRIAARVLAPLAAIVLLVTLLTGYANRVLFDSDRFADHVVAALSDDAVRDEVAVKITDEVVLRADRDLVALEPVIEGAAGEIVGAKAFQGLVRAAVRDLHRSIFKKDRDTIALTVVDVGTVLQSALEAANPKLAKDIGADKIDLVNAKPPEILVKAARVADDIGEANTILIVLTILLTATAVAVSPERRRTLTVFSGWVAIGAALLVIAYLIGRSILEGSFADPGVSAAAGGVGLHEAGRLERPRRPRLQGADRARRLPHPRRAGRIEQAGRLDGGDARRHDRGLPRRLRRPPARDPVQLQAGRGAHQARQARRELRGQPRRLRGAALPAQPLDRHEPAARPSNAEKVNASKLLMARIRRCARERDGTVNLIAVDFYATGDVFEVARALNDAG